MKGYEPRRSLEKYDVHGYLVDVVKPWEEWEESAIEKAPEPCSGKGNLHLDEETLHLLVMNEKTHHVSADADDDADVMMMLMITWTNVDG